MAVAPENGERRAWRRVAPSGKACSRGTLKRLCPVLAALLALWCTGCEPPGPPDKTRPGRPYEDTVAAVTEFIEGRMAEDEVTGLAVALIDGSETVWARGFGWADIENHRPVDSGTVFEIGSLSKTVTGLLIMRLVEDGLMDLDDPLALYVPEFRIRQRFPASGPVTIRSVLTHHSGIPGDVLMDGFSTRFDPDGFVRFLSRELAEDFTAYPVDFRWAYSNAAFVLAGRAAEAACGEDFIDCADGLLAELGMWDSAFRPRPDLLARLSKGYFLGRDVGRFFCNMTATGGAYSTVGDMARYVSVWLTEGDGVVGPDSVREMMRVQNGTVPLDPGVKTGLAWMVADTWAGRLADHHGGSVAHWCQVSMMLDQGLGVVVMTNSKTGQGLIIEAASMALRLAMEEKTGQKPPPPPEPEYSPPDSWTAEELARVAGRYCPDSGYDVFSPAGDGLCWTRYGSAEPLYVIPRRNGWFSEPDSQAVQLEFTRISERSVLVLHTPYGSQVYAEKIDPPSPGPVWMARSGRYQVVGLPPSDMSLHVPDDLRLVASEAVVESKGGLLVLSTKTFGDKVLRPLSAHRAEIRGLGRQGGTVVRFDEKGMRFLGLRYDRMSDG